MSSLALASLTATYTDSEGDDDEIEKKERGSGEGLVEVRNIDFSAQDKKSKIGLVSYHDDTVISDDEVLHGETDQDKTKSESESEAGGDIRLPPEPTGYCSNELQEKIARLYEKMEGQGLDMNNVIQRKKEFRNPSIYEKLIQFCGINELGTNYPAHIYDPHMWGKESYYEELAKVQKADMDRREKERKEKAKVEFVSGTAKKTGNGNLEDDGKRRKSKWDQVSSSASSGSLPQVLMKQGGLIPSSALTSNATGTKGTVISAFGSLPKKAKI